MVRIPVVTQDAETDNGPACLTALARAYGQPASLDQLRKQFDPEPDPSSALALCAAAQAWGLMLHPFVPGPDELAEQIEDLPLPAVLMLHEHHYVVADKLRHDGALRVMDPAVGRRWIDQDQLRRQASGMVLTAGIHHVIDEPPQPCAEPLGLLERMACAVRRELSSATVIAALFAVVGLVAPLLAGEVGLNGSLESSLALLGDVVRGDDV